jgi:hypothetical protein
MYRFYWDAAVGRSLRSDGPYRVKANGMNGAGGENRTLGLGIMRPSLYH